MNETNQIISGCSAWYEQTLGDCAKKESCLRYHIYIQGKNSALPNGFSAHRMCRSRALVFYIEATNA